MNKPLQFFSYQKGVLSSNQVSMVEIVKAVGTPVYVYSSEALLAPLNELKQGLNGLDYLICFALKSNSNIAILKLLNEAGAGMDLVSGGELYRAKKARVPAEKIVFSGVGKTSKEIRDALCYQKKGIYSFNVESEQELFQMNQIALELRCKAPVALRFNPDVDPKTHPYISTGLKKNKFGLQRNEILLILKRLDQLKGIQLKGLSIHIGSQLLSLSPLQDAFERLGELVSEVNSRMEAPLQFVDLGGGVGITYKDEKTPLLRDYCKLIHQFFGKQKQKTPLKILIEPGRTISGNAGILLTEVLYRKERKEKDFLVVDAAMNDLIRPALYESYHTIIPVHQSLSQGQKRKTDLVGPICESSDCFANDRALSSRLSAGDLLAILSVGAYGFSMSSNYNSRPRPTEVLIHQGKFHVIRQRERLEDLIRGESLFF